MNRTLPILALVLIAAIICAGGAYLYLGPGVVQNSLSPTPSLTPVQPRATDTAPKDWTRDAPIPLVAISPGSFLMGSEKGKENEKPIHKVTLTHAFYIGATEVTQAQWTAVMGDNPSYYKGRDLPVECIDGDSIDEFLSTLTESEREAGRLPEGMVYRLPTEAEWEYCCRAGSTSEYCFGDDKGLLDDFGWFIGNSDAIVHAVGAKRPNAWGLYDMYGNVWEWCYDLYAESYPSGDQTDPVCLAAGDPRVLRGGSWCEEAERCRCAERGWNSPDYAGSFNGFRVVVGQQLAGAKGRTAKEIREERVARKAEEVRKAAEELKKHTELPDCLAKAPIRLISVFPGSFLMGSDRGKHDEKPVHKVTLTHAFYMGATEVTQAQYRAVMNADPSKFRGDDLPVDSVSWNDAMEFCGKLTKTEREAGRLPEGMAYRLPTEAEWEYCCRAGSTTEYCFGDSDDRLGAFAWFSLNSAESTHPVGSMKANAWGLFDMHGNVWEWCYDRYGDYPRSAAEETDPIGPDQGEFRALRGGSWQSDASSSRSASRIRGGSDQRFSLFFGFRVVVGPELGGQ